MDIRNGSALKSSLLALAVTAAGLLGSVQSAQAQIQFNPTGGSSSTYDIAGLAFGPGNALAVNTGGAPGLVVGKTFDLVFQTHLTGLSGPNAPAAVPGLNGAPGAAAFQITEVATLSETVTSVNTVGGVTTATFALNPSGANRINIYEASGVSFNDALGTGFTNGTLIASLTPTGFGAGGSSFTQQPGTVPVFNPFPVGNKPFPPSIPSINGFGGSQVVSTVNPGYNVAFFQPNGTPPGTPTLVSSIFNSNLSAPFDAIAPSSLFTNPITSATITPQIGAINGVSGPDVQFQVSGFTQSFTTVVPEPASVTLMGLGVVGALVVVRRQRSQVA